ncbi:hypothetical protein ACFLYB_06670 [Chloroflexota bacterium]
MVVAIEDKEPWSYFFTSNAYAPIEKRIEESPCINNKQSNTESPYDLTEYERH